MNIIVNLIAFLLPVGIFIYFGVLGTAALSLLHSQRNLLQNLLLSPAIGIAFTLLPVFFLNRAGFPIKNFAVLFSLCSFLLSIGIILYRKPTIPLSRYASFALIFFLALFLTGRALLFYGFNWLSFANEDMTGYCLGALRFLNHGFFDSPNLIDMIQGRDYSQYYWFTFIVISVRTGSELLIAWLSGVTHLSPPEIFMPLIIGFYLTLISSTAGLVFVSKKSRKTSLLASILLAGSALTTLAAVYQFIAQMLGLSLFITLGALLQKALLLPKYRMLQRSILISIVGCALLISYPEIAPILGLALVIYLIIYICRQKKLPTSFFTLIAICLVESIFLLNKYWLNILVFIHVQFTSHGVGKAALFPYFLLPTGIPTLFGLQSLAMQLDEPWLSISIILGLALSIFTISVLIKQIAKNYFPAIVVLTIMLLALYLCLLQKQSAGFALFKLAMYVQPFLIAVLATGIMQKIATQKRKMVAIILVIGLGLVVQFHYVLSSYGELGHPYNELPLASKRSLLTELSKFKETLPLKIPIASDTSNIVSAKLQANFFSDRATQFYSSPFFRANILNGDGLLIQVPPKIHQLESNLESALLPMEVKASFFIKNSKNVMVPNYFFSPKEKLLNKSILIIDSPLRSIFNRFSAPSVTNENYFVQEISTLSNHLIFINSHMGQHYYFGESTHIALYGLERDYFYPAKAMAGIGRYFLFQVVNPSKKSRLVLNITETLRHDGSNQLPSEAKIVADEDYPLNFTGRGSARLFSPALSPRMIDGSPYLMVDFGTDGKVINRKRRGLMRLYGVKIPLDHRILVGYGRDISLISEQEFQQITPPSYLDRFPEDLKNNHLEYSGIYEDGWFSENVSLTLTQKAHTNFVIQGSLPFNRKPNPPMWMTVFIDNQKSLVQQINPGTFSFQCQVPKGNLKRNIRLNFSDYSLRPKEDMRPVAVKIDLIGFKPKEIGRHYKLPNYIDGFITAFRNKKFQHSGIYEDGWVSKDAYFTLAQTSADSKLVIDGVLPKQHMSMLLEVYMDDIKITESSIQTGPFKLAIKIPVGNTTRNIKLKFNKSFSLSKRDQRQVAVKINKVGFEIG